MPAEEALVLVTVTAWVGLSPIVYPALNVTGDGDKLSTPVAGELEPIPVSETVCTPDERVMLSVPVRVPAAAGRKVTETVQLPPTAMEDAQVVVSA